MKIMASDIALYSGLALTFINIYLGGKKVKDEANAPEKEQNERITELEVQVKELRNMLGNDNRRIENLEAGGRVLLRSLGALLSHGIDGNNIEEMRVVREELNDYLIQR